MSDMIMSFLPALTERMMPLKGCSLKETGMPIFLPSACERS